MTILIIPLAIIVFAALVVFFFGPLNFENQQTESDESHYE
jgi:uncharacterized membrane protein